MAEPNDLDLMLNKKSLGDMYNRTFQGDMTSENGPKKKNAGLEGEGLALVGVTLSDVPVNGVAYPKEKGANGNTVDSGLWAKADNRELTNDKGKESGAGK